MRTERAGRGTWRRAGGRAAAAALLLLVAACADDEPTTAPTTGVDVGGDDPTTTTTTTTTAPDRPAGPAADVSEEITGGDGLFLGAPEGREFPAGYVESEHAASGTAESYVADGDLAGDGRWTLGTGPSAEYRTRIVVRRPERAEDASGVVLLEWLNVSGGVDADPEWSTLREEIAREGHTWIGVSAQSLGIEGGEVRVQVSGVEGADAAGAGLRALDPERYGDLRHPGDAFSWDIYTQVARAVRDGLPVLDDIDVEHLIAAGESQSAAALVTYVNGVQPRHGAFDGFFVHSRGAAGLPLPPPGEAADLAGSIGGEPTILRTDLDVPVMVLQAENDVVGVLRAAGARQDDSDTLRLWEVAGTAHADRRLMGADTADLLDCGAPINDGPLHVVAKAALHHLVDWVRDGEAPPEMPRLELTDATAAARDADGIARGGIRTPPVDVPAQVLTGEQGPSGEIICILSGATLPMPEEHLAERYGSPAEYEARYAAAVDAAIEAGVVLEEDREAIEAYARPDLVPG